MGAGKTTVGRKLAEKLGRRFFDSDVQLELKHGYTARVLAERRGVEWLHAAEAEALEAAVEAADPSVIAAAASVAEHPHLDELVLDERVVLVLLIGEAPVLAARATLGNHRRAVPVEDYSQITRRRVRRLGDLADFRIDVTSFTSDQVVERILDNCFGATPERGKP